MTKTPTSEPAAILNLSATSPAPAESASWPARYALVTSWLLPATTARRTATLPLRRAYGVHLLAGILTLLLCSFMVDVSERDPLLSAFGELLEEFGRDPQEASVITASIILAVELEFLLLALAVLAWGAVDEPLRASWAHALRRVWLLTSHALPIVLLTATLIIGIERAQRQSRSGIDQPSPPLPVMPSTPSSSADQAAWDAHKEAVRRHQVAVSAWMTQQQEAREARWRRQPFLVRHGEKLMVLGCALAGVWFLWALYRASGTRLPSPPIVRPPTCEFCGYNLQGTPADTRCSECGEPVVRSLGPEVRPGTCWEHRGDLGRVRAWGRCALQAVFDPKAVGRSIRVATAGRAHRRFALYPLVSIWLAYYLMMLAAYAIDQEKNPFIAERGNVAWLVAPMAGSTMAVFAFMGGLMVAGILGMIRSLQVSRNLLSAAGQLACYLTGYLAVWSWFSAALAVLAMYAIKQGLFEAGQELCGIEGAMLARFFWVGPQLPWLAGYVLLLWRGITGAQYANR